MNSRKWVGLFLKTLILGGVAGLITSFFVKTASYTRVLDPVDFFQLLGVVLFFLGLGFVFSLISQTGFFAYLFINQFGLGFFRSFWPTVQVLLVAFVVFDLVYFPYNANGKDSLGLYILMSAAILVYGWIIAKIKAKQTNQRAFVPALFLMVVMTAVEWVPGLRTSGTDYAWLMIIPLLVCNTYQLLVLHRLTNPEQKEQKANTKSKKG
ncbi:KinB-signaling pathway activation protein [Virgibacillus phasianinus]|uniref:KinB-signaling pathway activation protein n=1 Tax=Virgibacillus phasianinus TaxID=2017483 RepID=A0A220U0I5_9BACI|nr:KinB-signaling pathway activation protein [Virgibacillus phasianinus]ASK61579.1 KinB-signaling pathway activation protein [Virgibacillus phasianinus]